MLCFVLFCPVPSLVSSGQVAFGHVRLRRVPSPVRSRLVWSSLVECHVAFRHVMFRWALLRRVPSQVTSGFAPSGLVGCPVTSS